LGAEQAQRLGVEAVALPVKDRADADDPELAAQVAGAGLVYLSGGDPAYLATTLRGTAVWAAIVEAWKEGASLAGCSAGAMALAALVPSVRGQEPGPVPGLGLLPQLRVVPHFDRILASGGPSLERFLIGSEEGAVVVGVDEGTALVGGPEQWSVQGRGSAWALTGDERQRLPAGSTLVTPLPRG
jgi:cyanophycinase-like exopeptidase